MKPNLTETNTAAAWLAAWQRLQWLEDEAPLNESATDALYAQFPKRLAGETISAWLNRARRELYRPYRLRPIAEVQKWAASDTEDSPASGQAETADGQFLILWSPTNSGRLRIRVEAIGPAADGLAEQTVYLAAPESPQQPLATVRLDALGQGETEVAAEEPAKLRDALNRIIVAVRDGGGA